MARRETPEEATARATAEELGRLNARRIVDEAERQKAWDETIRGKLANKAGEIAGNVKNKIQGSRAYNYAIEKPKDIFIKSATEVYIKHGSKILIGIIVFLLAFIAFAFYFHWWSYILSRIFPIISFILFLLIIFLGFKDKQEYSKWIAIAFILWGIDLIPADFLGIPLSYIFGQPYAGFNFNLQGIIQTDWIAVATSALFLLFIVVITIFNLTERKYLASVVGFVIMVAINRTVDYFGYQLRFQIPYGSYIFGIGLLIFLFIAFKLRNISQDPNYFDFPTFLFMTIVFSFFFSVNTGWMGNRRAWLHVLFILAFGFVYIRKNEKNNPGLWHILIPALLLADFYLYNIAWIGSNSIEGLQFLPFFVFFVIIYCIKSQGNRGEGEQNTSYAVTSLVFIGLIFFILTIPAYAGNTTGLEFQAKKGATLGDFYTQFADKLKDIIEGRLDIATAGLYRGSVEKNRYESLGVYFSNIRAAEPRFYTDEPITVWGAIRSKSYKDAVVINFSCYRWNDDKRIQSDKVIPDLKFPIFQLEEVDTQCTFLPKKLEEKGKEIKPGSNTITLSAEYNFATDSYLKTYFIDRDRFKSYAIEAIDPLNEFGIKDKKPVTVHTNGPVEIGMDAGPLVPVSNEYAVKPTIGITLTNRKEIQDKDKKIIQRWDGKIKNITELVLLTPPGITLEKYSGDEFNSCYLSKSDVKRLECPCNFPFKKYKLNDCEESCKNLYTPCFDVCIKVYKTETGDETGSMNQQQTSCIQDCSSTQQNCNQECKNLFNVDAGEGSGSYNGYALDVGSLEFKDLNKDIDKHRTFVCRYNPTKNILDDTPITTRYFRVRARYNYLTENSVTVNVIKPPIESIELVPDQVFKSAFETIKSTSDSYFPGFSPEFLAGIAAVESGFRHCCKDESRRGPNTCEPDYSTKDCPTNRIITSGSSIGIMGIKYDDDPTKDWVNKNFVSQCAVKSIYNLDCNILVGALILKKKYNEFQGGCQKTSMWEKRTDTKIAEKYPTFIKCCANGVSNTGVRYDSYIGYDAAIRAYNGWGCSKNADLDYVEKVKSAADSLRGAVIVDKFRLKSVFPTDSMPEGGVRDEADANPPSSGIAISQGILPSEFG